MVFTIGDIMERVILIEYGELTTKKGNREFFINTLKKNISNHLSGIKNRIFSDTGRMVIEGDIDNILPKLNYIFGIHAYHVAYRIKTDKELIDSSVVEIMKNISFNTFKVEVKRSDKTFPINSMEYASYLGGLILKNITCKVDVHSPDTICMVEIRKEHTFIYNDKLMGLGGYPTGTQPKGMLMLSGGIDSPVAGYLSLKRGMTLDAVYFEAIPHTSIEARNKVIDLAKKLANYQGTFNLHVVNFTEIQESIYKNCDKEYMITIMRRMMYRIMEKLCDKFNSLAIINGESLGQVASQTIESMHVINNVTNYPVIRPCVCMDKLEIIKVSKEIDTYNTSILPYEDCCTIFVPTHPVIRPNLEYAKNEENKFNYEEMINKCIDEINTIEISNSNKEFNDIL